MGPAAEHLDTSVAKRLYYDSPELEFDAKVTDIRLDSRAQGEQLWQVALDRTTFYPEGGGQPWDTGTLTAVARSGAVLEVAVERVEEDERGEVWHFVRKPLVAGTEVFGRVDFARRTDHEQQHSGQHLLSAMFLRELGAKTVSFHLGATSSTIDLALREGMEKLSEVDLRRVEEGANKVVIEGRPFSSHWIEREMADLMLERGDLRKVPERDGPLRIVQMQGIEFNACGGTHVSNTGAIGSITLRRVEKVKQGWRVEFCCGLRAVRAARQDHTLLNAAAGSLSVGAADVPGRVAALLDEAKAAAKDKRGLLDQMADTEAERLLLAAAKEASVVQAVLLERDVEFCKRVVSRVAAAGMRAVVGSRNGADGVVAAGRPAGAGMSVGSLLRETLQAEGGRGGGSSEMAQGVCGAEQVKSIVGKLAERMEDGQR